MAKEGALCVSRRCKSITAQLDGATRSFISRGDPWWRMSTWECACASDFLRFLGSPVLCPPLKIADRRSQWRQELWLFPPLHLTCWALGVLDKFSSCARLVGEVIQGCITARRHLWSWAASWFDFIPGSLPGFYKWIGLIVEAQTRDLTPEISHFEHVQGDMTSQRRLLIELYSKLVCSYPAGDIDGARYEVGWTLS